MGLMQPEEAVSRVLLAAGSVTDLVSDRIHPSQGKYKAAYPLVLYERTDSDYLETLDGLAGDDLAHIGLRIEIVGKSYAAAKAVATAVRTALNAYSDTVTAGEDSLVVRRIRHTDESDAFDDPAHGRPDGIHRVIQEYDVWFYNS